MINILFTINILFINVFYYFCKTYLANMALKKFYSFNNNYKFNFHLNCHLSINTSFKLCHISQISFIIVKFLLLPYKSSKNNFKII